MDIRVLPPSPTQPDRLGCRLVLRFDLRRPDGGRGSGTREEMVARTIHELSPRRSKSWF